MVTERAIVIRCQGGRAEVEVQRTSVCGGCELAQGCGTGAIGRLLGNRQKPVIIDVDRAFEPGDQIMLGLSDSAVVRASFLLYGLPLIGLLVFSVFTQVALGLPEWAVVVSASGGLWIGFVIARWIGSRLAQNSFSVDILDIGMDPGRSPES